MYLFVVIASTHRYLCVRPLPHPFLPKNKNKTEKEKKMRKSITLLDHSKTNVPKDDSSKVLAIYQ